MTSTGANTTRVQDSALLLIRLAVAAIFLYHGSQKLFGLFGGPGLAGVATIFSHMGLPYPYISAVLSGCAEFFGGLIFLLGSGLRISAVPLSFNMLVATVVSAHHGGFSVMTGGCEYPLSLLVVVVAMGLLGPGGFTLGALLRRPLSRAG